MLVDIIGIILGFKDRGRLNHAKHLEKGGCSVGWAAKAPVAIAADMAAVNVPVAARISEGTGHKNAFNEPLIIYHNGFVGKSLTIKNLFHGDLRVTTNSESGIMQCEAVQ